MVIDHLSPVGWADVATERDLDALEGRIGMRFDGIDRRLDDFRSLLVTVMTIMAALFAAMAGAIVAAIKV